MQDISNKNLLSHYKQRIINFWKEIVESITGTEMDFTTGHIGRAVILLSIPMVLEMTMESVFAVADIFYVSKLGAEAVATVGLTESLLTLVYAIGIGFSMATTAVISRRIGEKNKDEAAVSAFQSIIAGFFLSLILALPGIFYAKELLILMGATPEVAASGYQYTALMLSGNITIMWLFIMNAVFRSAGDAAISMKVLAFANMVNIILDPCLIFGWGPFPEMGITGAAIATNTGRGLAVLYQFYLLFKGHTRIRIEKFHIRFNLVIIKKLFRISAGGIGQHLIATFSWIFLVRIIAVFGSNALAGYTIALRILLFSILPSFGLSNAAATLVGQNLGAKNPSRAERSVWMTAYANMVFLGLIGIFFIIFSDKLVQIFIQENDVVKFGSDALKIISFGMITFALEMVMLQAFNGAGDTQTPTIINFICFWLIEIPLAYFLAISIGINQDGVYYSIIISEALAAFMGMFLFIKGRWKLRVV